MILASAIDARIRLLKYVNSLFLPLLLCSRISEGLKHTQTHTQSHMYVCRISCQQHQLHFSAIRPFCLLGGMTNGQRWCTAWQLPGRTSFRVLPAMRFVELPTNLLANRDYGLWPKDKGRQSVSPDDTQDEHSGRLSPPHHSPLLRPFSSTTSGQSGKRNISFVVMKVSCCLHRPPLSSSIHLHPLSVSFFCARQFLQITILPKGQSLEKRMPAHKIPFSWNSTGPLSPPSPPSPLHSLWIILAGHNSSENCSIICSQFAN